MHPARHGQDNNKHKPVWGFGITAHVCMRVDVIGAVLPLQGLLMCTAHGVEAVQHTVHVVLQQPAATCHTVACALALHVPPKTAHVLMTWLSVSWVSVVCVPAGEEACRSHPEGGRLLQKAPQGL